MFVTRRKHKELQQFCDYLRENSKRLADGNLEYLERIEELEAEVAELKSTLAVMESAEHGKTQAG